MTLWQRLSPNFCPAPIIAQGSLMVLRERLLQGMLIVFSVLGLPVIILAGIQEIRAGDARLAAGYFIIYSAFLAILFLRDLPYTLRGTTLTGAAFVLALAELFESGQMGDVRMFLIAFTALTGVLFGYRNVIVSILVSLALIAGLGLYNTLIPTPFLPVLANLNQGTNWIISSATFLMISTILSGAISMLISGLGSNLNKQSELAQNLERERDALEGRIHERTASMTRRMAQLHAAAEISRAISALSDPETMLQQVIDLVRERFELYYVGVFLLDSSRTLAILQAGTGEAGKRMIAQKHHLTVGGSSMIGWSIANRQPRIALDVGAEAVRFNNPNLPLTRSELALPIIARDFVLGALTVQSEQSNAFDENDIAILESVADSIAIALENDRLYHETRKSLEEIRALNHEYLQRAWAETVETYGELNFAFENQGVHPQASESSETIEVPLLLRDEVIGVITLEMNRHNLSEDEQSFVENVSTQTAVALENARLLHESERRAVLEQKLNELTTRFSRAQTIEEILRTAAQELGQLPTVAEVSVQLQPTAARPALSTGVSGGNGGNGGGHRS
jgi:GAF domain-containing protein